MGDAYSHADAHGHGAEHQSKHGHGPDPIKEFHDRNRKLQAWIETHRVAHSDVYNRAAKAILKGKDGIDTHLLEDSGVQQKFIDKLVELYLEHAKDVHGITIPKEKKGSFSENDILHMMSGYTRSQLEQIVKKNKGSYNSQAHHEFTAQHIEELQKRHGSYVVGHLDEKRDKKKILKFINAEGLEDQLDWNDTIGNLSKYLNSEIGQANYKKMYAAKKPEGKHH